MKMRCLTHKIELDPAPEQVNYFVRACGTARFVYNWALAEWNRQYDQGGKPRAMDLKKQFNAIKYEEFEWLKEIHRDAHARPFHHLRESFANYYRKRDPGNPERHKPKFKKKCKSSCTHCQCQK